MDGCRFVAAHGRATEAQMGPSTGYNMDILVSGWLSGQQFGSLVGSAPFVRKVQPVDRWLCRHESRIASSSGWIFWMDLAADHRRIQAIHYLLPTWYAGKQVVTRSSYYDQALYQARCGGSRAACACRRPSPETRGALRGPQRRSRRWRASCVGSTPPPAPECDPSAPPPAPAGSKQQPHSPPTVNTFVNSHTITQSHSHTFVTQSSHGHTVTGASRFSKQQPHSHTVVTQLSTVTQSHTHTHAYTVTGASRF
eukprot:329358-Prorocentrum_minimum.AAC.1